MQNQQAILSSMLNRLLKLSKTTILFTLALIISFTSITVLLTPSVMAYPGELDTNFNVQLSDDWYWHSVYATAVQADGKILVGGTFTLYNGTPQNYLIRLNPDYSKDTTFDVGNSFSSEIKDIVVQADGKIIVGGCFTEYNGTDQNRIIRLNPNGTKDTDFAIGDGANSGGCVESIDLHIDGKIVVAGEFTKWDNEDFWNVVRLNPNGTKDTSFAIDSYNYFGQGDAYTVVTQQDSKIILGGYFYTYDDPQRVNLTRINTNGTKDISFAIGAGFNRDVRYVALQPDGKILVGGLFTEFNGDSQGGLVRLNPDGSKDTSFNIGTGFDDYIESNMTQLGAAIIIGGRFTSYDGTSASNIARIQITDDKDQDGKDDDIEDSAPNSGDGNQDGTKDSIQANVSSYTNPVSNQPMAIQVDSSCSLSNITNNPSTHNPTQDTNYSYPLGLYDFTASCGTPGHTTNLKAYYYNADTTKNYSIRKYNPNTNTYTTIDNATFTTETIAGQPVLTATYNITDGSSLDTDNQANGIIVDPAGPALTNTTTATLPTAPNTGVNNIKGLISTIILMFLTILASIIVYKNRSRAYKIN